MLIITEAHRRRQISGILHLMNRLSYWHSGDSSTLTQMVRAQWSQSIHADIACGKSRKGHDFGDPQGNPT
jgi:hypothetical protein